ncbi:MAG: hypothetical protein CME70_23780 [Halobacteriovorax sp.]|nr:hypothetical protein [Halobacteriovorax sp.]|tara:strand:- start:76584 stop:79844 length:3261 start_codon:yes stop_codon:yes gene_type:complete
MMFIFKFNLSIFAFLFAFSSYGNSISEFNFDKGAEGWAFYGKGEGQYSKKEGRKNDGSLYLSAQWGDEKTAHYYLENLKPGVYEFSAWIKMFEVQLPAQGDALWHFYDNGSGIESVFRDVHGSCEWSQIKYKVKVTSNGSLDLWFRLKVPGRVWIDDITLRPEVKGSSDKLLTRFPLKKESLQKYLNSEKAIPSTRLRGMELFSFEKSQEELEKGHPFNSFNSKKYTDGIRSAELNQGQYYNFDLKKLPANDWSAFEYIELDIYNPLDRSVQFYLVLGDSSSNNYWSKLNHKTKLASGWNTLSFNLKQWVGERGSHKLKRSLDLKNLKEFFVVVDPDNKIPTTKKFLLDKIRLSSDESPVLPKEILAFDFTNHPKNAMPGFTPVTSQSLYRNERGFGFVKPKFWRMQDSVYADTLNRYSISMTEGSFRIKLPNGRYQIHLNINSMGYWDVPFWRNRTIYLQGLPAFKESRSFGKDYLYDYLIFEETEPVIGDHPFDLYLKRIFSPYVKEVFVNEGYLDIGFEGDASSIGLNSLILFKKENTKIGQEFLANLEEYQKKSYSRIIRSIPPRELGKNIKRKKHVALVNLSSRLEPKDYREPVKTQVKFLGLKSMRLRQLIQFHGVGSETKFKLSLSKLKTKKGDQISGKDIVLSRLMNSFISENLNHETYLLGGKYFRADHGGEFLVPKDESRYILLEIPISKNLKTGLYSGFLKVNFNKEELQVPIEVRVKSKKLPEVMLPVGFLGLDPLQKSYFSGKGYEKLRWLYRDKALKILSKRGFTSFSGLPKVPIVKDGEDWSLDFRPLEQLLRKANRYGFKGPYFSYGGEFPSEYFDDLYDYDKKTKQSNHKKLLAPFEAGLKKLDTQIVYTFSDEAGGYSDKIKSDLEFAKFVKANYPTLRLGGFTQTGVEELKELNNMFDFGFYANFNKSLGKMKNQKWGAYNGTPRALDDPRFGFGPMLFAAQKEGLSHYLDWHMAAYNNYPYFDLDGRESEIAMVYPRSDGSLAPSLKLELSAEGLQDYRLLLLLEKLVKRKNPKNELFRKVAKKWLSKVLKTHSLYQGKEPFTARNKGAYSKFKGELLKHVSNLLN